MQHSLSLKTRPFLGILENKPMPSYDPRKNLKLESPGVSSLQQMMCSNTEDKLPKR